MPKITNRPQRLSRTYGRTGYAPSALHTGLPAQAAANSMRLVSSQRQIYACNCYPADLIGRANASETDHYIVSRYPEQVTGTTERLYACCVLAELNHEANGNVLWYPNYAPGTLGTAYYLYQEFQKSEYGTLTEWQRLEQPNIKILNDSDFTVPEQTAGDFHLGLLRFDNLLPLALGVFHHGSQGNAPTALNVVPGESDMSKGAMLRGYDSALLRQGIGDVIYRTCNASGAGYDFVTSALGSPVFAWGIPGGVWIGADGSGSTRNVFGAGATLRIRARTPFNASSVPLRPTLVYSAGDTPDYSYSMTITATANGTGSTVSSSLASAAYPTLYDFGDATGTIEVDKDAEAEVTVEVEINDTQGDHWLIVHSLALWPDW